MPSRQEGQGITRRDLVFRKPRALLFGSNPTIIRTVQVLETVGKNPQVVNKVVDVGIQSAGRIIDSFQSSLDRTPELPSKLACPNSTVAFTQSFEYIEEMSYRGNDAWPNALVMAESSYGGIREAIDMAIGARGIGKHQILELYRAANMPDKAQEVVNQNGSSILLNPHFYAQGAEYTRRYGANPRPDLDKAYELAMKGSRWGYVRWQEMQVAVAHARAGSDRYAELLDLVYRDNNVRADGHSMDWLVRSAAECGDFKRTWEYLQNPNVKGSLSFVGEDAGWEFINQGKYREAETVAEYALAHGDSKGTQSDFRPAERAGSDWQVELQAILVVARAKKSIFGGIRLSELQNAVAIRSSGWVDLVHNNLAIAKARRLVGHRDVYDDIKTLLDLADTPIHSTPPDVQLGVYQNIIKVQSEIGDNEAAYSTFRQMDKQFPIGDETSDQTKRATLSVKAKAMSEIGRAQAKKEGRYH